MIGWPSAFERWCWFAIQARPKISGAGPRALVLKLPDSLPFFVVFCTPCTAVPRCRCHPPLIGPETASPPHRSAAAASPAHQPCLWRVLEALGTQLSRAASLLQPCRGVPRPHGWRSARRRPGQCADHLHALWRASHAQLHAPHHDRKSPPSAPRHLAPGRPGWPRAWRRRVCGRQACRGRVPCRRVLRGPRRWCGRRLYAQPYVHRRGLLCGRRRWVCRE